MKRLALIAVVLVAAYFAGVRSGLVTVKSTRVTAALAVADDALVSAIDQRRSNVQVQGSGRVTRVLTDDNDGSRHQRFIIQLGTGQTLLMAHNIDLAQRIESLKVGDRVAFSGEYEWNARGGVIHWTHHDPAGRHLSGWIKHHEQTYR